MYLAFNKLTNEKVVVKINSAIDMNDNEFSIMQDMSGISGFPQVHSCGVNNSQPYIVLEKLGCSMKELM